MRKKVPVFNLLFLSLIGCSSVWGQNAENPASKSRGKYWEPEGIFYGRAAEDELVDKRTRISKTFKNADGTKTIVFGGLTHYKDETGKWQEVNYNIEKNNSSKNSLLKYCNTGSEIKSYFPEIPGNGIVLNYNNQEISFWNNPQIRLTENGNTLLSKTASAVVATPSDNMLRYNQSFDGMDDEFVVLETGAGIEHNIVVKSLSRALSAKTKDADLEFYQFIPLSPEWDVYHDSIETKKDFIAESFLIKKKGEKEGFVFNPIIVYNHAIQNSGQAFNLLNAPEEKLTDDEKDLLNKNILRGKYKIHFATEGIEVYYILNYNWFADTAQKFPVIIDPSITIGSASTSTQNLWDGYYTDTRVQALYLATDFTGAGMVNGDIITAIGVDHTYSSGDCTGSHTGLKIRMKNTASTTFGSTSFTNTGYTDNYSGTKNVTSTTGWYTHTLSATYGFNSSQNVIIDFTMNMTSYLCSSPHALWNFWNTGANRRLYSINTGDIGDPQSLTTGTLSTNIPYIQVTYTSPAPANDVCSGAITLSVNSSCTYTAGTSANANASGLTVCSGTEDDDVWYKFVATATTATVTVDGSATYDAAFELRTGACNGTLKAGSCTDSYGDGAVETYAASGLTVGATYYIRVWDYKVGSGSGTFDICVYGSSSSTPCASAISIGGCGSSYAQSFSSVGSGVWNTSYCGYTVPGDEQVYSFVAPTTGTYSIVVTAASDWMDYGWLASTCTSTGWNCISDVSSPGTYGSMSWTAGTTYYILLDNESSTTTNHTFYISCPPASGANIALADNGTQVAAASVAKGTSKKVLHQFSLAVTNANATLTGLQCVTAGNYASADITNLKVRYSANSTLDAGDATLSTITGIGTAGTKTFTSFTSQVITSGTTGYIFITADIAAGATANNTISINAVTTAHLTFSSGTKSGSTTAAGTQTITAAPTTPSIALANNGTQVAAANVAKGTNDYVLHKFSLAITTANATFTDVQCVTAGTYVSADVTNLKVRYSTNNTLDAGDATLATITTPGTAGTKYFPTFSQSLTSGTTAYIFITADIAAGAVTNNYISVNAIATTDITFIFGTESGSTNAGGNQTFIVAPPANDAISGAIALTNTDYYPPVPANWVVYSNANATNTSEPATPSMWTTNTNQTIWFKFTATTTAQSVSTDYSPYEAGMSLDTRLAIYSSSDNTSSGTLTLIGGNDNINYRGASTQGGDFNHIYYNTYTTYMYSAVTVTGLTIGNTYFIRVDADAGNIYIATETAPSNDACSTAQAITLNSTYTVNTRGASLWSNLDDDDVAFDINGLQSQENVIYYTFTPSATDVYYINQSAQTTDLGKGTQFVIFNAGYNCSNLPSLTTGFNTSSQMYISNTTTGSRYFSLNLTGGQTYYIGIDGGSGDEAQFTFAITKTYPLPISLLSFSAKCSDNPSKVNLTWTTATEADNEFFTVQRSTDGRHYITLGTLPGAGNSSVLKHYSFSDMDPLTGVSYYHISQTDYNGQSMTYSPLSVTCSEISGFSINVNSNLDNDGNIFISIQGAANKKVLVVMTDVYGKEVYSMMFIENTDSYLQSINLEGGIPKGIYFIIASSNDTYMSKKIVIK